MVKWFKVLLLSLSIITSSSIKCAAIANILVSQLVGLTVGVGSFTGLVLTHELGHALTSKHLFDEDIKIIIGGLHDGYPLFSPEKTLTIAGLNPIIAYSWCDGAKVDDNKIKDLENLYKVGAAGPIAGGIGSILVGLLTACSKLRVTTRAGLYISSFTSLCVNVRAVLPNPTYGSDGERMQRIEARIQQLKIRELASNSAHSFEEKMLSKILKLPPLS